MVSKFSPKYSKQYRLFDISVKHFLVLAIEAIHQLQWNIEYVSEDGIVVYTKSFLPADNEKIVIKADAEKATITSVHCGHQVVGLGKNRANVQSLVSKIKQLKKSLMPEATAIRFFVFEQNYFLKQQHTDSRSLEIKESQSTFDSLLKLKDSHLAWPIIAWLNVVIFGAMILSGSHLLEPDVDDLINWGANFPPFTLNGEWWRLMTAVFVHAGLLHLLANMYGLVYVGLLLEPYLGKTKFAVAYLLSGLGASVASLCWNDLSAGIGASGAIFGMYGVLFALLSTNMFNKLIRKSLLAGTLPFVAYSILSGFIPGSNVDNAAHLGGLLSGLLIGYVFVPGVRNYKDTTTSFVINGGLMVYFVIFSVLVYTNLPKDIAVYLTKMEKFTSMKEMALEAEYMPEETTDEDRLWEIENRSLYYWEQNLLLLDGLDRLDVSSSIKSRNSHLRKYCKLKIKKCKLMYQSIDESTDKYQHKINQLTIKIDALAKEEGLE